MWSMSLELSRKSWSLCAILDNVLTFVKGGRDSSMIISVSPLR